MCSERKWVCLCTVDGSVVCPQQGVQVSCRMKRRLKRKRRKEKNTRMRAKELQPICLIVYLSAIDGDCVYVYLFDVAV